MAVARQEASRRCVAALSGLHEAVNGGELASELGRWLAEENVEATRQRVRLLLEHKVYPHPPTDRPAVPWLPI
jgi:hypothetical protein